MKTMTLMMNECFRSFLRKKVSISWGQGRRSMEEEVRTWKAEGKLGQLGHYDGYKIWL